MNESFITALVAAEIYRKGGFVVQQQCKKKVPQSGPNHISIKRQKQGLAQKIIQTNMRELILLGLLGIAQIQPWDSLSASGTHPQSCN